MKNSKKIYFKTARNPLKNIRHWVYSLRIQKEPQGPYEVVLRGVGRRKEVAKRNAKGLNK